MNSTGHIRFQELIDVPKLQALLESFHQFVGISNAVIDTDGIVIAHAGWQDACTKFHRTNPATCQRCVESDTSLVKSLTQGASYAIYGCLNGLVDTAAPIMVDGQHVANVFTGQFLTSPPDMAFFARQAREFGFDETKYLEAIARVPVVQPDRVEAITRLYAQLASTLADNGLDRLKWQVANAALKKGHDQLEERVQERTSELQRSEERFRALSEAVFGGIVIHDNGIILECNQGLSDLTGYRYDELIGMQGFGLIAAETRETVLANVRAGYEQAYEVTGLRKDGSRYPLSIRGKQMIYQGRMVRVIEFLDITERKQAEREREKRMQELAELNRKLEDAQNQLMQSEKMASVGQLAAGVAHEINNPIGFVFSNLGSLKKYLDDIFEITNACEIALAKTAPPSDAAAIEALKADKDFDYLRSDIFQLLVESQEGLSRVKKIVQDLKDFSRPSETNWQWADLHAGIDSTLNIVWNELKYKCTLHKEYGDLPPVRCLPAQLNQVFMNLLVNAAQSILDKGAITIRTGILSGSAGGSGIAGDDRMVFIAISDTGVGIAPEHLHRLFEPFFTTKPVGKGTGLGLSLSYSFVLKHGGRIEVASAIDQGSTFTVILPVTGPPENVVMD